MGIIKEVNIDLTPEELAVLWCDLDSNEMAVFFNTVAEVIRKECKNSLEEQMAHVTLSKNLNMSGRGVMSVIGDYSTAE